MYVYIYIYVYVYIYTYIYIYIAVLSVVLGMVTTSTIYHRYGLQQLHSILEVHHLLGVAEPWISKESGKDSVHFLSDSNHTNMFDMFFAVLISNA